MSNEQKKAYDAATKANKVKIETSKGIARLVASFNGKRIR